MGSLITEVRDHALKRPWLLAAPLIGLLGQNVVAIVSGSVGISAFLTALMTAAVTTLFTELWMGDGRSVDPKRFVETGVVFFIPYPLLFLFGLMTTPFVYWMLHANVPQAVSNGALFAVLAAGKLTAFAAGAVSALAAVRRREAAGARGALRLGVGVVSANAGFFLRLLSGVWLFQEACVFLARSLAPGLLGGFLTTVIPLIGCVAFPIEAWRSGRLTR